MKDLLYLDEEERDNGNLDAIEELPTLPQMSQMPTPEQADVSQEIFSEADDLDQELSENDADIAQLAATRTPSDSPTAALDMNRISDVLEQYGNLAAPRPANMGIPLAAAAQQIGQSMAGRYSGNFKADNSVLKLIQEEQDREAKSQQEQLRNMLLAYRTQNQKSNQLRLSPFMTKETNEPLSYDPVSGQLKTTQGEVYTGQTKLRNQDFLEANLNIRELMAKLREKDLERKETTEGRLKEKFEFDKEQKDEMSDAQVKDFTSIEQLEASANKLGELFNTAKSFLGPYSSRAEDVKSYIPLMEKDPKYAKFKAEIGDALAQYIKNISGAAVSDQEREFLQENQPKITDKPGEFEAKLKITVERINRNKKIFMDNVQKQQGKKITPTIGGSVEKDPKIEEYAKTHKIDYNKAEAILRARGYGR